MEIAIAVMILIMSRMVQRIWPAGISHSNGQRTKRVLEFWKNSRYSQAAETRHVYLESEQQCEADIF